MDENIYTHLGKFHHQKQYLKKFTTHFFLEMLLKDMLH